MARAFCNRRTLHICSSPFLDDAIDFRRLKPRSLPCTEPLPNAANEREPCPEELSGQVAVDIITAFKFLRMLVSESAAHTIFLRHFRATDLSYHEHYDEIMEACK